MIGTKKELTTTNANRTLDSEKYVAPVTPLKQFNFIKIFTTKLVNLGVNFLHFRVDKANILAGSWRDRGGVGGDAILLGERSKFRIVLTMNTIPKKELRRMIFREDKVRLNEWIKSKERLVKLQLLA